MPTTTSNDGFRSRRTKIERGIAIVVAAIIMVGLVVVYSTDRAEVKSSSSQPNTNNDAISSASTLSTKYSPRG
jgi:hypothetical protein